MSLLERIDAPHAEAEIEPGKRLIRGGDRGLSLSERLSYRLHRLSWGTPLHALRLRGRHPLKLLTVPKDPIAGDKAAGEAILKGQILHGGRSIAIDSIDFAAGSLPPALSDYLQSFAWLRDLAAAATRERGAPVAEKMVRKWLDQCGEAVAERSWRGDLWGRRIFFWTAYAPYILSTRDLVYRSRVLNGLARGSRHIDRGADKAPPGLKRITAWSGVIASALVIQGGPARLSKGEAGIARALAETCHEDGGLISRSPAEQLALVELLGQLRAVYYAARAEVPEAIMGALERGTAALLGATLGDGALGNWQGGNMLSARRVSAAVEGTGLNVRPLRGAQGWGYQQLAARKTVLLFDAAPPPPARAIRGGCASTLAFEMSDGAHRLIVNCGGAGEAAGALPAQIAEALRSTAAHSTLTLADRNSTAVHEDGTLGKGVSEVELFRDDTAGVSRVEGSHDGYVRRFGLVHRRKLQLSADGLEVTGEDLLEPKGRRRRGEAPVFVIRFHLAPGVEVTSTADGQGALLRIRGGAGWRFRCRGGIFSIEESLWIDGEGQPHRTHQLVISGEAGADGASAQWSLKRAG
ncbi:MAG TPA: heparinase II/III family protein [Allosphingosinicella sp.]|uniref:heparinase II/III family protein n=1 Tax=Allosphingosinicella sp. TaxID=2823234 RepID=UPI002ED932A2